MTSKYIIWVEFKGTDGTLVMNNVIKHCVQVGYLDVYTASNDEIVDYHIDMSDIKYYSIHRDIEEG